MTTPALSIPKGGNPLRELASFGQSVWLDYIRRSLITSGELKRLVAEDGLRGVTSNPAIFEKAIVGSTDYASVIESAESAALDAKSLYEKIAIKDMQDAADILRTVWEDSKFRDGFVSLEVSPLLAHDTAGTLQEARRLWKAVDRPNLMVKVPATPEGIPAIRQLISEGININVTLLFSREAYEQVANAYIEGLDRPRNHRRRHQPHRQRRQLLRQPHRLQHRRATYSAAQNRDRSGQARPPLGTPRQSRYCQRQACLSPLH